MSQYSRSMYPDGVVSIKLNDSWAGKQILESSLLSPFSYDQVCFVYIKFQ